MVSVTSDDNNDSHNETLTGHQLGTGLSTTTATALSSADDLATLLSLLRLQPDAQLLLGQLLSGNSSSSGGAELMPPLTNELHAALLESSKSCLNLACPLVAHLCSSVHSSTSDATFNNKTAEFCATALLELIPSVVVATFLYGSTSHSLLETTSAATAMALSSIHQHNQPQPHVTSSNPSNSVPPSPTVVTFQGGSAIPPPAVSSPSASIRQVLTNLTSQSEITGHISPEFLLEFVLYLVANGSLMSLSRPGPTSAASRAVTPNSPPTLMPPPSSSSSMPAIHHFASLVAPSVYHNPVLFGASAISDNAQTEHHQHERRVRIQTTQLLAPVASIISSFNPNSGVKPTVQPGMVAPLAMAALADFNHHYAVQLTSGGYNVQAIMRCCDAALRLLALPVSSPSLQSVSPGIVLQFVYFVSIAAAATSKIGNTSNASAPNATNSLMSGGNTTSAIAIGATGGGRPSMPACRKTSTTSSGSPQMKSVKHGTVSFDIDNTIIADTTVNDDSSSGEEDDITDEKQLCRLKLLQVLHAARNLAELRLWPDVLAVVKAVKNTSGLGFDLGEDAEGVSELALSQPTSVRAITNASFKARKLPDDIEALVDQKEVSSPVQKRAHGQHTLPPENQLQQQAAEASGGSGSKRSGHHHHHRGFSAANQFTSHWRAGKHSAAIASLQAAFRLPERLRSRRRSFGVDVGSTSGGSSNQGSVVAVNQTPTQATTLAQRVAQSSSVMTPAGSFSLEHDITSNTNVPVGPRLEMRIFDNPTTVSSSLGVDGIEETVIDERHQDLPMIDDAKTTNGSSDNNTPRSRTSSVGQQQSRTSIVQSALGNITRTGRS